MTRPIALLAALAATFAIAGCGGDDEPDVPTTPADAISTAATTTDATTTAATTTEKKKKKAERKRDEPTQTTPSKRKGKIPSGGAIFYDLSEARGIYPPVFRAYEGDIEVTLTAAKDNKRPAEFRIEELDVTRSVKPGAKITFVIEDVDPGKYEVTTNLPGTATTAELEARER